MLTKNTVVVDGTDTFFPPALGAISQNKSYIFRGTPFTDFIKRACALNRVTVERVAEKTLGDLKPSTITRLSQTLALSPVQIIFFHFTADAYPQIKNPCEH